MKIKAILPVLLLALAAPPARAAVKDYDVRYRAAILKDEGLLHEWRDQTFGFRMEIVADGQGLLSESSRDGNPYVTAVKGERYSVRLFNPLPVTVAVNLTVDGINSISGKPCGVSDGEKWIIGPYGSVTVPGWQVSGGQARRFFFTDKRASYARWRGGQLGRDLAANCGVIGAAFFWSREDLNRYYDAHPIDLTPRRRFLDRCPAPAAAGSLAAPPRCAAQEMHKKTAEPEQAGTGMGERQSNPTVRVDFDYDTGMYSPSQALVVYYGFARAPSPNPFPDQDYAPEMP